MATELVIKSWCDPCLEAGTNTPGETVSVAVTGTPAFDVEVCPEHGAPLSAAVAVLAALGRRPGKSVPTTPTRAPRAAPAPSSNVNKDACPTCGRQYATRNALRGHLRAEHGQTLADAGLVPANFSCPTCGASFAKANGLGVHLRTHDAGAEQSA